MFFPGPSLGQERLEISLPSLDEEVNERLITRVLFTILFLACVIKNTAELGAEIVKSSNTTELLARNSPGTLSPNPTDPKERSLLPGICPEVDESWHGKIRRRKADWGLDLERRAGSTGGEQAMKSSRSSTFGPWPSTSWMAFEIFGPKFVVQFSCCGSRYVVVVANVTTLSCLVNNDNGFLCSWRLSN